MVSKNRSGSRRKGALFLFDEPHVLQSFDQRGMLSAQGASPLLSLMKQRTLPAIA